MRICCNDDTYKCRNLCRTARGGGVVDPQLALACDQTIIASYTTVSCRMQP
jgi:hypothetical protein